MAVESADTPSNDYLSSTSHTEKKRYGSVSAIHWFDRPGSLELTLIYNVIKPPQSS